MTGSAVEGSECPYLSKQRQLTPHCCWYQREGFVFLTVEVMDCQEPEISVLDDKLLFTCDGAEGRKYELDLQLLHDINTKESRYAVRARVVEFRLVKVEKVWWERLLREKARQHWLRVDFQNWKDEEDVGEESEPFEEMSWNTMMEGFKRHEGETGQNPFDLAKQQNDQIKKSIEDAVGPENMADFQKRVEKIKQDNEEKERVLAAKKREIRERVEYFEGQAPHHARNKFRDVLQTMSDESKIVEIDDQ